MKVFLNAILDGKKLVLIGAQELANEMNFSRPRAYAVLKQLVNKSLLEKYKRKGFILTSKGESLMHKLVHREKILEVYFYKNLNFDLEEAQREASSLCIFADSLLINKLCEITGVPNVCPHGVPIQHDVSSHE